MKSMKIQRLTMKPSPYLVPQIPKPGFHLHPGGMRDNSPTFQRWGTSGRRRISPEGTTDGSRAFGRPFGTYCPWGVGSPNVETLGYCRMSLRDSSVAAELALIVLAGLLLAVPLHAQIVADGATRTLSNVTSTFTGDVTVGTNGPFTLLVLSDNALLTNSAQGVIGRNLAAKSNEVRLVSASARWRMGGSLFVGLNGAANQLTVSNGGVVQASVGDVGLVPTSSNNVAVVTGTGSLWSHALELVFGFDSPGNQLVIGNGGMVRNGVGYLGNTASANNNVAVVTDPDSV